MISADSSVMVAYLNGEKGADIEYLERVILDRRLVLAPTVVAEILSNPSLPATLIKDILKVPMLEISEGYWRKAGFMRAKLISKKLKARLADTLIAQSCLDHDVALMTRDVDFRHFKKHCGLKTIEF